jgi:dihydropyrimidinase
MHHGGDYTPYEGYQTQGYPVATYVRGELVFDGEKIVGPPGHGRFLPREPYPFIEPRGRFSSPFNPVDRKLVV